jgi:hypothetical protein
VGVGGRACARPDGRHRSAIRGRWADLAMKLKIARRPLTDTGGRTAEGSGAAAVEERGPIRRGAYNTRAFHPW